LLLDVHVAVMVVNVTKVQVETAVAGWFAHVGVDIGVDQGLVAWETNAFTHP
jgi:hypothetical protein